MTRPPMRIGRILVFVAGLVSLPSVASADSSADALVERGVVLRRQGDDRQALALFQQAYEVQPSSRAQAQIALAEQALGNWAEAERHLVVALEGGGGDAWITKNRVFLERSLLLMREHLGTVVVVSNVQDVTATVNGVAVGRVTSDGIRVPAGPTLLEVEASGFVTGRIRVLIRPGEVIRHTLRLDPVQARPAEVPASAAPRSTNEPQRADGHSPPEVPSPSSVSPIDARAASRRTWAWVATAGAGIFLTEAIVAQALRQRLVSDYNDELCWSFDRPQNANCPRYRAQADAAQIIAFVGYGASALSALAATYLFATSKTGTVSVSASIHGQVDMHYSLRW